MIELLTLQRQQRAWATRLFPKCSHYPGRPHGLLSFTRGTEPSKTRVYSGEAPRAESRQRSEPNLVLLSVASDGGYYKRWEGPQPHVLLPCQLFAPPTLGFSILSALYVIQMFSSVGAT